MALTCSPVEIVAALLDAPAPAGRGRSRQPRAHRLGGRLAQQVLEDLGLAALLAGLELDLAAEHVDRGLEVDHAGDRAASSPCTVARCSAAAAMVSAPAIENRAETPERWSTELDSRSARVNRARISTRWSGTSATSSASWRITATSSSSSTG